MESLRNIAGVFALTLISAFPAWASEVTIDLSDPLVQITAGFSGTNLLIFGVILAHDFGHTLRPTIGPSSVWAVRQGFPVRAKRPHTLDPARVLAPRPGAQPCRRVHWRTRRMRFLLGGVSALLLCLSPGLSAATEVGGSPAWDESDCASRQSTRPEPIRWPRPLRWGRELRPQSCTQQW